MIPAIFYDVGDDRFLPSDSVKIKIIHLYFYNMLRQSLFKDNYFDQDKTVFVEE